MSLLSASCVQHEYPRVVLIINPTASNRAALSIGTSIEGDNSEGARSDVVLRQVLSHAKHSPLRVVIAAEETIRLDYPSGRGISLERINRDLVEVREDQIRRRQDAQAKGDPAALAKDPRSADDFWGYGTDHVAALESAADFHDGSTMLLTVLVSDGYNESGEMVEVDDALLGLFKTGPVHFIMAGVTQGEAQSPDNNMSVMARWEQALSSAGAMKLDRSPHCTTGYHITSDLGALDTSLLRAQFREE